MAPELRLRIGRQTRISRAIDAIDKRHCQVTLRAASLAARASCISFSWSLGIVSVARQSLIRTSIAGPACGFYNPIEKARRWREESIKRSASRSPERQAWSWTSQPRCSSPAVLPSAGPRRPGRMTCWCRRPDASPTFYSSATSASASWHFSSSIERISVSRERFSESRLCLIAVAAAE
jgi:hypothetical protein